MPQGISPNPLNKISEVYLSQISEHHKKDADGNTIPHEGEEVEEGAGLYANIHAKRKRGGKMRKKGDKGAPSSQDFANAARTAKEEVEVDEAMAMKPSNMKKKAKLGAALDRLQALKVAKKKKEMGEEIENEGMQYGIFKGDGKPKGAMAAFGKKKNGMVHKHKHEMPHSKKITVKTEELSNWKEDYVWEADEEQMEKEVKEKKVKNKIIINPKLGEAVEELGGQLLDVQEMSGAQGAKEDDPQLKSKMLRQRQLKKQVLLRKLQAVRQTGGEDIVASHEPEGEQLDEIGGLINKAKNFLKKMRTQKIPAGGGNFIKGGQMRDDEIKNFEKSLTNSYEPEGEQLDEYGNPRVGMRLRAARAIDSINPRPKVGSKRTAISNKLKMSAIKAETKRREQKENPYSAGKKIRMALGMSNEDYIPEEGYDICKRYWERCHRLRIRKMQQRCQEVINLRNQQRVDQHSI